MTISVLDGLNGIGSIANVFGGGGVNPVGLIDLADQNSDGSASNTLMDAFGGIDHISRGDGIFGSGSLGVDGNLVGRMVERAALGLGMGPAGAGIGAVMGALGSGEPTTPIGKLAKEVCQAINVCAPDENLAESLAQNEVAQETAEQEQETKAEQALSGTSDTAPQSTSASSDVDNEDDAAAATSPADREGDASAAANDSDAEGGEATAAGEGEAKGKSEGASGSGGEGGKEGGDRGSSSGDGGGGGSSGGGSSGGGGDGGGGGGGKG
jgi:hypothetical protein